ncbi:type II toxin-antitoxin system HicB family antitoxin [Lactobacillus sp. ESL0791]|uniref:type II toxin-antitoxin system HicB family antitoxin n=1 Tax=Lactobacillus sp. ESL0791 TaxID=2983234 RepID=UPI0023F91AA7|nr:type II toxin-antitoxin system HicB family antitoxin [Lactobacillus sp. ESL0791]MDF7638403.1 type II toxin-antitoxin system HicB family antitoxin [Lactobacillus sp. ESL0791]
MTETKKMFLVYPAIFTPEKKGGYFIDFPDVQGAFTGINTNDISYGIEMAEEALGLTLADYIENNDAFKKPTAINELKVPAGSFATLIKTDVEKYLTNNDLVKKTLTIPKWADQKAKKQKLNFSALLTKAILHAN